MLVSVVPIDATKKPVLGTRALNRATLARQLLLRRSEKGAADAVAHLLGLQAQNVKPPYFQLWSRLEGFEPAALAALMESREVLRMVTMRSTIHTHTAEEIAEKVPRDYNGNDKALYIEALRASVPMFTTDARMPDGGPENVLKVLATYKPQVRSKNIDLSKTFTNAFVAGAKP